MHFKKLRLAGFKSFVDPTELHIEKGVTGIVGPNGCGKSNLLEALKWVMGESSAKSMRGTGMDDVIFAGTDRRPARPFAEVVLTIDNSDRSAPAQFNHEDTLEISRRITREMGSTYRINGKEVRARDLQVLFADAATGSNSPSLVRQGQISQLIHAKPKQRRVILEEAAGIGGLYTRRYEAELRLKGAGQNLERIEDNLKSTETRLLSLKKQAKQAEAYRDLSSKIRKLESVVLYLKYQSILSDKQTAEDELVKIKSIVSSQELEASGCFRKETELTENVVPLREELAIASAVLKRSEVEAMTINQQRIEAIERIGRLEKAKNNIQIEKDRETQLTTDAQSVISKIKSELAQTENEQHDAPEEINLLNQRVESAKKELNDVETELDNLKNKINELTVRNQSLSESLNKAKERKRRLEEQYLTMCEQEKKAQLDIDNDLSVSIFSADKEKIISAKLNASQLVENLQENIHATKETEQKISKEYRDTEAQYNKINAEIKGLSALVERVQVKGTAKNLDKIHVVKGYEKAFGVVFGDTIDFDDNPNQPCYWQIIEKNVFENVSFPAKTMPLSQFVQVPDFLKLALSRIAVFDISDFDMLRQNIPLGVVLVSVCGRLLRSDGFVIRSGSQSSTTIMLEQRNKLAELKIEAEIDKANLINSKNLFDTVRQQLSALEKQDVDYKNALRECERHEASIEKKLYEAENNIKIKYSTLANIGQQKQIIQKELADAETSLQNSLSNLEKITGTDTLKQQSEELKTKVTDKRMALADTRALLETKKRIGLERANRIKSLKKDSEDWNTRFENAQKRVSEASKKLDNILQDIQNSKELPDKLDLRYKDVSEKLVMASVRHKEAQEKSENLEGELSVISKNLRHLQTEISKNRENMIRLETNFEIIIEKEKEILLSIEEKINNTPENLRHELSVDQDNQYPPLSQIEEQLRDLNKNRDKSGPVNLLAEQELSELEKESELMINEKNDLLSAINKLNTAIKDLNKEGREKILIAFDQVNTNFKRLFTHLFSGGLAELKLVESDDPLEAGLEIFAQPPGKKTASLSLLSGGEQALTCMALIFAVFLTNPSPICVLDEVDAPLDDANVERYCNLINEMTKVTNTRFLVITHHSLTMARTDRLFGVTMAERGVSQLVSVNLKEAETILDMQVA